jgi:phosphate transport system permease protein
MPSSKSEPRDLLMFAERPARERLRIFIDRLFGAVMAVGGIAVIAVISLIFLYLFYVVAPLFQSAEISANGIIARAKQGASAHIALDEYASASKSGSAAAIGSLR